MKEKFIGYYSVFIGISVIALWIMILFKQSPPEGKTELAFHLFSEFLMAMICLVSGILLLKKNHIGKPLNFIGLGMAIYSILNAAGYYGQNSNFYMMIMFILLFIVTMTALLFHFTFKFKIQQRPYKDND